MHRYYKIMLKSATAVALVWSAATLTTTEASAQFGFEGLIRGAMSHGYYGGYSRHHGRVHESRRGKRSKHEDADDEDSSKGKDTETADKNKKTESADKNNKTDMKPASAVSRVDSSSNQGQPQTTAASSTTTTSSAKANTDIPAFSPSR